MRETDKRLRFKAKLLRPAKLSRGESWAFLILPRAISEKLPRRGRLTVSGTVEGTSFQAMLEPDGQLSHWLKLPRELLRVTGTEAGDMVTVELSPVAKEPEPSVPVDFATALNASPRAMAVWESTTTLARIDWIHWIESAKQAKTRQTRVENACDMLAEGKKRVCCFDPSGFYSKSLSAPDSIVRNGQTKRRKTREKRD